MATALTSRHGQQLPVTTGRRCGWPIDKHALPCLGMSSSGEQGAGSFCSLDGLWIYTNLCFVGPAASTEHVIFTWYRDSCLPLAGMLAWFVSFWFLLPLSFWGCGMCAQDRRKRGVCTGHFCLAVPARGCLSRVWTVGDIGRRKEFWAGRLLFNGAMAGHCTLPLA